MYRGERAKDYARDSRAEEMRGDRWNLSSRVEFFYFTRGMKVFGLRAMQYVVRNEV